MIVRMAKVEIIGPKGQLLAVLGLLRGRGVFQPDPELMRRGTESPGLETRSLILSAEEVQERLFFEDLQARMRALLERLPDLPAPAAALHPLPVMGVLAELVDRHLEQAGQLRERLQQLRSDDADLARDLAFWQALEPLLAELPEDSDLEFFGVAIRDAGHLQSLQQLLRERLQGQCQVTQAQTAAGALVGLVATSRQMAERLRQIMTDERVPELPLPADLAGLPVAGRIAALRDKHATCRAAIDGAVADLEELSRRWRPVYRRVLDWLDERLALYRASATAYETRQCFVIEGWMAAGDVAALRRHLAESFGGRVVLELLEIMDEELDRVPVMLHNPAYFQPFEVFSRLLPLPKYTSYDPTPFIGLFFPLLFGMTLGDAGYGALLLVLALALVRLPRQRPLLTSLGKVLGVAAVYTLLFGLLYGELFGNLGQQWFGLQPLWVDRAHAIMPMIVFSVSVGTAHVLLGLGLGLWTALRRHQRREALVKLLTVVLVVLGLLLLAAWLMPGAWLAVRPLVIVIAVLLPVLVMVGGGLAPLELLKTFGNIISYVRIMAVGLPAIATAWAQSRIGSAGAGTLAEKPELTGTIIILVAIPETMVILGFVVAAMILMMF